MGEPFSRVWDLIKEHRIRHIPVVDPSRRLKGIVMQRDLYRTLSPKKKVEEERLFYLKEDLDKFILSKVMTKKVAVLSEDQTIGRAFDLMVKKRLGAFLLLTRGRFLLEL